ncbi:plasmid SOS inhibition protein A, partial [Klebsiella pneumoniae]|nr:plasmid SOS inhibition protein A [Klebsiella pneumoniae]
MESTALVPLGVYQHCAMASVAYVEHRRTMGRNLGELAYAKAFFRALTGKAQITSSDVRQVDASYDPSVRGESTKMDYMRAIDLLIDTRGEVFTLPLSWSVAVAMFPGI